MVISVREALATAVKGLRVAAHSRSRRAWAKEHKLDLKMVERLEKLAERDSTGAFVTPEPGIDVLQEVADACKIEPWQLLHPNHRVAALTPEAIAAAAKLDEIEDHEKRRQAYALWRFIVEHGASIDQIVNTLSREMSLPTPGPAPQSEKPRVRTP